MATAAGILCGVCGLTAGVLQESHPKLLAILDAWTTCNMEQSPFKSGAFSRINEGAGMSQAHDITHTN